MGAAPGAESDGAAHECLVLADAKIRQHGGTNVARLVDQIGGASYADPQRADLLGDDSVNPSMPHLVAW